MDDETRDYLPCFMHWKRLQKGCGHGPKWSAISPVSRGAQGLPLVVHSGFLSPSLEDMDRVLHAVASRCETGSSAQFDLSVSDGHLSAVARHVSQFLVLFHLTWVVLKCAP